MKVVYFKKEHVVLQAMGNGLNKFFKIDSSFFISSVDLLMFRSAGDDVSPDDGHGD